MGNSTNSTKNCQRFGVIYLITNMINGKSYVGQTIQKLSKRLYAHKRGKNQMVDKAIQKYGWENLIHEVLEENIPREMLDEREIFWIAKLKTKFPNGYNLTDGGDGGRGMTPTPETLAKMSAAQKARGSKPPSFKGKHHSEEAKAKISEARQNISPETRAKMSAAMQGNKNGIGNKSRTGQKNSPETLAKMSASMMGHEVSAETRAKISKANSGENNSNYGKPLSEETRAKISASMIKHYEEHPEAREHLAELNKGKHHTEESKAKMSAAKKARDKKIKEEKSND